MARGAPAQARYTKDQYFELVKKGVLRPDDRVELLERAGVPEYWIVNLRDDCVEVYRRLDRRARCYGETRPIVPPGSASGSSRPPRRTTRSAAEPQAAFRLN